MELMMTEQIKAGLKTALPGTYAVLQEKWTDHRLRRIQKFITGQYGLRVQAGPFSGMEFLPTRVRSFLPKILGSYERELYTTIEGVVVANYRRILNIGCAEGYYAVGLALRMPAATVHAFDINPAARELCAAIARANSVSERVLIEGECDVKRLNELTGENTLIVCDCEGCELSLLQPKLVPGLSASSILVELHDFIHPDISATLLSRFEASHDITIVTSVKPDPSAYPALHTLNLKDQHLAVAEFRPEGMQWAFMTPR